MQTVECQTSVERIKQLVKQEGKAARNLVTWSVPIDSGEQHGVKVQRVTAESRGLSNSKHNVRRRERNNFKQRGRERGKNSSPHLPPLAKHVTVSGNEEPTTLSEREEMCKYYSSKTLSQPHSSTKSSRFDLHARYWSYLFDNLHRAVDEIYKTCEVDESIVECQEVVMTLEVCRKDFEALIQRIRLFEQSDLHTKSSNLAWEVRKTTSPGKPRALSSLHDTPSPPPPSPSSPLFHNTPRTRHSHLATTTHSKPLTHKQPKELQYKDSSDQLQDSKHSIPESSSQSSCRSESRLSSARSLDFSNVGHSKSRIFVNQNASKSASFDCKSEASGTQDGGPTWADRVKGISRVTSSASTSKPHPPSNEGKGNENHSVKEGLSNEESSVEDEWKMVTRGRAKSTSANSRRANRRSLSAQQEDFVSKDMGHMNGGPQNTDWGDENSVTVEELSSPHAVCSNKVNGEEGIGSGEQEKNSELKISKIQEQESEMQESAVSVNQKRENEGNVAEEHKGPKEKGREVNVLGKEELSPQLNIGNLAEVMEMEGKRAKILEKRDDEDWSWNDALALYDANESYRAERSWADRCDSPPEAFSDVPRSPGRAIHLHQRLSSPSRKRQVELEETRRIHEEKQAKAQLQRSKLQEEKTQKSRVEADKIREARESRDALARQRKEALEDKMQRAEMLRESHLQERIRRAQEEEAKVSEISFINTLEAQNRKIEVQERYQGREARLQELLDERQRRRDEQLAKEEAAQERRRTMEAERQAKLLEMDQRRRDQEAKVEQMLLERERAREEAAKEKAKERERKLMAHNVALQISSKELGRKIQLKQDESSKRYDQQIEQRKKLATGVISSRHTSADNPPRVEAYKTKKWCIICNIEIVSEVYLLSHLRGRKHQANLALLPPTSYSSSGHTSSEGEGEVGEDPVIIDAAEEHQGPSGELPEVRERMQAGKKRAKKLRQRMTTRMKEIEKNNNKAGSGNGTQSKNRTKLQKALRELNKQVDASSITGGNISSRLNLNSSQLPLVDRALGEINRALVSPDDQICFCHLGGVALVVKMLMLSAGDSVVTGGSNGNGPDWSLPEKTFSLAVNVLLASCAGQLENCRYLITSNKAIPLVDLSLLLLNNALSNWQSHQGPTQQSKTGKEVMKCSGVSLCGPILRLLASMVSMLISGLSTDAEAKENQTIQHVTDIISYMVSVSLVDRLSECFSSITGPIEQPAITQLVLGGLNLLVATTAFLHLRVVDVFSGKSCDDPTLLTTLLKQTELMGLMQLLYAILLSDGPPRHSHTPPLLTQHTLAIAMATIKALNNAAILDLKMVQSCLGAEGISLEFRHIVSYLLWCCSHYGNTNLLHELILAVGYFCVLNHDNQVYLQSGRSPTLLQLLCGLPFEYFSNPKLSRLLYPSLIAACYQMKENKAILEEEISSKLLVVFLQEAIKEEKDARKMERTADKNTQRNYSVDLSSMFQHRFPRAHWESAIEYFSQS